MSADNHEDECSFMRGLHWHRFNNLESKLVEISKYITIDHRNSSAWGEELADLYVLVGNEINRRFFELNNSLWDIFSDNIKLFFETNSSSINRDVSRHVY